MLINSILLFAALAQPPAIYVVGDSTASNANRCGWGDPFADYFDPAKVQVFNRARAGRSSRTFITDGLWDKVLAELKQGDYVLIQFGHNDGGPLDTGRARGSLPGHGEETREISKPDGSKETVHTYGYYMRKLIADARAKGATPIVLSLTVRNIWQDGRVERGSGRFGAWAAEVALAQQTAFIDATNIIADRYETMGEEKVKPLFPVDHTHTSQTGADLNASAVIAGVKLFREIPFAAWLSDKGKAVARAPYPMQEPADLKLPSVYLMGDSTVRNGRGDGGGGQWGWGETLRDRIDTSRINVVNRALGGLSSRTYLNSGLWDKLLLRLKRGDVLIMQFGHNDNGPLDDKARARGTLQGTGEETREIENPITGKHEIVHTYGWYLRQFIAGARAKGATPIVCSPVPRKTFKDGKIVRSSNGYAKWAADAAAAEHAPFIDLYAIIARQYDELGPAKVEPLFGDEHTHTSRAGAELNADAVITGLKALKENPLAAYIK